MLPVMACRAAAMRLYCSPKALRPGAQEALRAAGLVWAYMSASLTMSAALTPQISAAQSGVLGVPSYLPRM